ncbi:hypothetical protein [Rhizobium sp. CAU 1783]
MTVYAETVLERVLLAIIEAHPSSEFERRPFVRLQQAMAALLGRSPAKWEAADKALAFMARERQKDICDAEMSMLATGSVIVPSAARSVSELAEVAARDVLGLTCVSEISVAANFLCQAHRRDPVHFSVAYDPASEAMQDEAVQRILDELAEWDIPHASRR